MRMMLRVRIPTKSGNKGIESGALPQIVGGFVEQYQPEASYFVADGGDRTAIFFVDMKSTQDIPSMCEPFFMGLNAEIDIQPAMDLADMQAGVAKAKAGL